MVKRVVRRNEFTAWTGTYLRALCYTYTRHQLNRTPSSTDPSGHRQSPGNRWPSAPFYHSTQELHPWGCLVHGFTGQRSKTPNRSTKSRAGIFVGHSEEGSGYLVYHEATDEVVSYGHVDVFPQRFPMRDRMLAGENPATLVNGDWRRWSNFEMSEVEDGPLSEYLTGKQIQVTLPQSYYPSF
jgi:hypothetical protein